MRVKSTHVVFWWGKMIWNFQYYSMYSHRRIDAIYWSIASKKQVSRHWQDGLYKAIRPGGIFYF